MAGTRTGTPTGAPTGTPPGAPTGTPTGTPTGNGVVRRAASAAGTPTGTPTLLDDGHVRAWGQLIAALCNEAAEREAERAPAVPRTFAGNFRNLLIGSNYYYNGELPAALVEHRRRAAEVKALGRLSFGGEVGGAEWGWGAIAEEEEMLGLHQQVTCRIQPPTHHPIEPFPSLT